MEKLLKIRVIVIIIISLFPFVQGCNTTFRINEDFTIHKDDFGRNFIVDFRSEGILSSKAFNIGFNKDCIFVNAINRDESNYYIINMLEYSKHYGENPNLGIKGPITKTDFYKIVKDNNIKIEYHFK